MPRVHHRKARKDYPNQGIEKGDMYYTWRIKMAYGGVTYRSKEYPKPWQLTHSEFKSAVLQAEDALSSVGGVEDIESLMVDIEGIRDECQEKFDNMPEGLQQGDTGMLLEERVEAMDEWLHELQSHVDDEPQPDDFMTTNPDWEEWSESEPDREDFEDDDEGDKDYEKAYSDWQLEEPDEEIEDEQEYEDTHYSWVEEAKSIAPNV